MKKSTKYSFIQKITFLAKLFCKKLSVQSPKIFKGSGRVTEDLTHDFAMGLYYKPDGVAPLIGDPPPANSATMNRRLVRHTNNSVIVNDPLN